MEKNIGQQAYELLLQDPRWKRKAYYIKKRDENNCVICGGTNNIQVHHLNYGKSIEPWDVPNEWLVTLCEDCHKKVHQGTLKIDYPKVGKFYKNDYGSVGIVCKIDRQTSNVILLRQNIQKEYAPKLDKTKFCYFCEAWHLVDNLEENIANWFYIKAKQYSYSIQSLIDYAVDPIAQSCAVGDFEDCFITREDLAYTRKVLESFVEDFTIPAVRPKVGNFYIYEHSDFWNCCLCVRVGEPNGFDDLIYMLEYDCGGSSLWIGRYTPDQFYELQCNTDKNGYDNDSLWDSIICFIREGEYRTTGYSTGDLSDYEIELIKKALYDCASKDKQIQEEIEKAEERRLYQ